MGEGEEVKTRPDPKVEIKEKGEIFFFYRPKVNKEEAHNPDDVQRLYIVMRPESGERPVEEKQSPDSGKEGKKASQKDEDEKRGSKGKAREKQSPDSGKEGEKASQKDKDEKRGSKRKAREGGHGEEQVNIKEQPLLRLAIMGKKMLPDPRQRGRPFWGHIDLITTKLDDIKSALKGEEYDTGTRGHRHTSEARAVGEGVYRILRHQSDKKNHTHLIYKLELPVLDAAGVSGPQESPQKALNIDREASFLIQIKNPEQPGGSQFRGLPEKRKAAFPAHLQGQFGQKRYSPADPPDFLNYEGCEFLLISASDHIEEELGLELKTECNDEKCSSDLLKMFGDAVPTKPLLSGTWQ